MAFLGPDGAVYKVARRGSGSRGYSDTLGQSRSEAERYKQMKDKVEAAGARLAACKLYYNSVLVMEHIPRPETLMGYTEIRDMARKLREAGCGFHDLHDENVWKDPQGIPTLIDYAA
jgi:hypothetical protein